jgi:hypothetical protein
MFLRFVGPVRDEDSHRLTGVFQAAYRLRDRGSLSSGDEARLASLCRWFGANLPVPSRFSRSRRPRARGNAVCWFKRDAADHIGRVWEIGSLLENHGVVVRLLWTNRPGYLVYEDRYQVAAVPFRDTPG